jgi:hypothetical protein
MISTFWCDIGCPVSVARGVGVQEGLSLLPPLRRFEGPQIQPAPTIKRPGGVPERLNGAVSKTVVGLSVHRGFESLPLRFLVVAVAFYV